MPLPSQLHALPRKLSALLALVVVASAAACSPENSRACEVDANCFVDERCIAGFCQFDPTPDAEDDADENTTAGDTDLDETNTSGDANLDADVTVEEDVEEDAEDDADATLPLTCLDHQTICDSSCVDLQYDPAYCGNCTTSCTSTQECSEGACIERLEALPEPGLVATSTNSGFATDVTLDSFGRPHITHIDNTTGNASLHYLRWDGEQWHSAFSHPVQGIRPTRIALDANNRPHILFGNPNAPQSELLLYAAPFEGGWQVETVATPRFARNFDLALAPDGSPRVVYLSANDEITLATRTGSHQWQYSRVENQNTAGASAAIAVDQNARTHIAYQRFTNGGELIYATSTDNGWRKTPLATSHNGGLGISMVFDPLGGAHIAARANTPSNPAILYLTNTRGDDHDDWSTEVHPLSSNASEASTSIALMLGGSTTLIGYQQESSAHLIAFLNSSFTILDHIDTAPTSRTAVATGDPIAIHAALRAPDGGLYYLINNQQ
ncbi:hypothetical protein FRC98_20435 [Lujinxingia vulgaris]|uniref:4Fe-4S ferredoxin-type domain-containing protein n=1 Tax=Lujinxingia vulgaris TaxID=2600176 RepID=A0A5C6X095_9DELT|nr:hypothetical protein [Lujinxingia vulgaris]TXD33516.1 hypothetical protein FRC98_20435 [Lujinxingia vulgaris]